MTLSFRLGEGGGEGRKVGRKERKEGREEGRKEGREVGSDEGKVVRKERMGEENKRRCRQRRKFKNQ